MDPRLRGDDGLGNIGWIAVLNIVLLLLFSPITLASTPKVVVTISPIYALTQAVMQNVAEPILLVAPGASPHNYALTPAQVSHLHSANLVIWMGESLETFLIKTIAQLPKKTNTLTLLSTPLLNPLPFRTEQIWHQQGYDHSHDHSHQGIDPHVWLDPIRTQTLVLAIAEALITLDPDNKKHYQTNAEKINQQLAQLEKQLQKDLTPVQKKPFIVFHDAYQYLEQRYNLNAVAAITLNPEIMPSAKHISAIQNLIKQKNVVCIFSEPQFKPAIVEAIVKDTGVREGILNPEDTAGVGFAGYQHLMTGLSVALQECLS